MAIIRTSACEVSFSEKLVFKNRNLQNTLTGEVGDYLSLLYIGESRFITELFLYAVFARAASLSPDASMQLTYIASPPFHRVSHDLFQTCLGLLVAVSGAWQGAHYPTRFSKFSWG